MTYKFPLSLLLMVLLSYFSVAQPYNLQGRVTDNKGKPLGNIAVSIKGLAKSTYTGKNGVFEIDSVAQGLHTLYINENSDNFIAHDFSLNSDLVFLKPFVLKNDSYSLDEVVIKGSAKVGNSIESLSAMQMDADQIRKETGGSLIQTLERLPGIKSIGIGSSNAKPLIRGLGFNQVAVIENGIKHQGQEWGADHGLEVDQYNVDRLEIIKGPASFLYGSDALGGIINIMSNSAPAAHSLGGSIDVVGRSNNLQAGGSLNLYGRSDRWFFNLRSTYMNYADYRVPTDKVYIYSYAVELYKHFVRNTAGREFANSVDFGYLGAKATSTFSISNNFNKSGFFANAHGIAPINVDRKVYDRSNRDILLPSQQVSHTSISNQTKLFLGMHTLEVNLGFQNNLRNEFSKYVAHGYMPPIYPDWMTEPFNKEREFNKKVASINVSDKISLQHHSLSYGVNSDYQDNRIGGWGFLIPSYRSSNIGAFVYDKYFLTQKLTLLGALRYDYSYIHVDGYKDWFESEVPHNGTIEKARLQKAEDFTKHYNNMSWSAGLLYTTHDWTLSMNVGKSFRMPIAKELAANGVNYHYFRYEKGNNQLSPEESYQLDLGVAKKGEKLKFSLTPFVNYFSNYILLTPTSEYDTYYGAGNQIFNYREAQVFRTGFELQAQYQILPQLGFDAAIEYLYGIQLSGSKKDYPLPFTPPASGIFSVIYQPKIWDSYLQGSFVKLDMKIAAAQHEIVPPEKSTPGYNVWGLSLGSSVKTKYSKLDFSLNVYNLFNTHYFSHTSFYRLIELPEQGRNFVLSLKIPFVLKA